MAQDLSLQPAVDVTDINFPNGKIVDGQTIIDEGINQDIIQFFQKLMADAGLVANGLYDNEANGYQFVQALEFLNGGLRTKVVEIGDWNMDADNTVLVAHGLTLSKIRTVKAMIRNDANSVHYDLLTTDGSGNFAAGYDFISSSDVSLRRTFGGFFDGTSFNSTSYNRGWVIIQYDPS